MNTKFDLQKHAWLEVLQEAGSQKAKMVAKGKWFYSQILFQLLTVHKQIFVCELVYFIQLDSLKLNFSIFEW